MGNLVGATVCKANEARSTPAEGRCHGVRPIDRIEFLITLST